MLVMILISSQASYKIKKKTVLQIIFKRHFILAENLDNWDYDDLNEQVKAFKEEEIYEK